MQRIFRACISVCLILLLNGCFSLLAAGQVTLEISTSTRLDHGNIVAHCRIINKGTDPAQEVSVLGTFLEEQQNAFIAERLSPGASAEAVVTFTPPENLQGSYPLYITVSYQHADGMNVSSSSLARVNVGIQGGELLKAHAVFRDDRNEDEVILTLDTENPNLGLVTVTSHAPADLSIMPPSQKVSLQDGKGLAIFTVKNISGAEGSSYGIFFAAEYDSNGQHNFASAEVAVPVAKLLPVPSYDAKILKTWFFAFFLCLTFVVLVAIISSKKLRQRLSSTETFPHLLDLSVLLAVEVFIFSKFDLPSLFTATTTTGGDTASHYYTLEYLRHTLLPAGHISGWTMGNYAGFPILQFYFPLPFLIMCLLDLIMPLQVAFKMGTLLGTAALPVAAYSMLRFMRCPFPGPGVGAALMLPFLFNSANSMWGGNILSTLAGEFSYSLSMSLSLILIGSLYRGIHENKGIIRNAILVFLVGFSHGYTLLFAEAVSLFLLITPYGFTRRVFYLFRVYALGFCLLAFWLVPLLVFAKYTTSYHLVWTIHSVKELVPEILLPPFVLGLGGSFILLVAGLLQYRKKGPESLLHLAYLWFGLTAAVVFFVAAPRLGVVDIRYVPYGQLLACLMGALFLGWSARYLPHRWGLNWLLLIIVAAAVMNWTNSRVGPVTSWSKWNYEGFESKNTWAVFESINKTLAGNFQDPRVVFEHSQEHNVFGSSRAFESLPLFAGRATLEGLYMQASITAPFVFYIQSIISRESSMPFPQYSYTTMDFNRARRYLKLFNVRDLIIRSKAAKQAIKQVPAYELSKTVGQYEIWQLKENPGSYVEVLEHEPLLYQGAEPWKEVAHQWFTRDDPGDVLLVFNETASASMGKGPLKLSADDLDGLTRQETDNSGCKLRETIKDAEIFLETSCPGKPHLIKVSYHPNWQVEGAERIYLVSPSFMLIYPQTEKVHLFYGPGPWDRLGQVLSLLGLAVLLLHLQLPWTGGRTAWSVIVSRIKLPALPDFRFLPDPEPRIRKIALLAILVAAVILVAAGSYRTYVNEPSRVYNRSIRFKDEGRYEEARAGFRNYLQTYPLTGLAQESSYYIAITFYLEKKDQQALNSFEEYLQRYPQGNRTAEVQYHLGLILLRSGKKEEGIDRMLLLIEKHPESSWAGYARERLLEQGYTPQGKKLDINSSNLEQYMGRAIAYFNQDRLDEAKPIFREISERFPDYAGAPQALAALALCYYKADDCLNTINYYQKLVERYPEHRLAAEAYYHLGLCFEQMENTKNAEDAYRKILTLDPDGPYANQARIKVGQ